MVTFLQIMLVNLVVSIDNVGVIALATRSLPKVEAHRARKIGIILSFILKLLFLFIIKYLFQLQWLHIRIIGGILLLYVSYQMMKETEIQKDVEGNAKKTFLSVLISIVAVDVSMSLDNIVAIISIVTKNQTGISYIEMFSIGIGLLACIPILFYFSTTISKLMEKYDIITYLCGGYLVYLAVKMICEDEILTLFFERINFMFSTPLAILCGFFVIVYGLFRVHGTKKSYRSPIFLLLVFVFLFSVAQVIDTAYLVAHTRSEYTPFIMDLYFEFAPRGANAIYTLSELNTIFCICSIIIVANVVVVEKGGYFEKMQYCIRVILYILLFSLCVTTIGFTYLFGFGSINILEWVLYVGWQMVLYAIYTAFFFTIASLLKHKYIFTIGSIIFLYVEELLGHLFHIYPLPIVKGFLRYHMVLLPDIMKEGMAIVVTMLVVLGYGFVLYKVGKYIENSAS